MNKQSDRVLVVTSRLKEILGDRLQTSRSVREHHSHTTTLLPSQLPDMVAFPQSTQEISQIVKVCDDNSVPVIPFGAGSSLEGHVNAPQGGVSIDMTNMSAVLEVAPEDLLAVVQPGITRKRLNEELRATGLQFPIDPGADASVGGMVSTRASGTNAVRYGTMADNILELECVLADGQIIRTGSRAKKSAAGYDLTKLIAGSEGTLCVITEVTLKLRGIPEHVVAGYAQFATLDQACTTVIEAIQCGIDVGRIELLDPAQIKASNAYSKLDLAVVPTLFYEFSGGEAKTNEEYELFAAIAEGNGVSALTSAKDAEDRAKLWAARHDAYWAALAQHPGQKGIVSDACVPISKLASCIEQTQEDLSELGLDGYVLGHVGDGNFHVVLCVDPDNQAQCEAAEDLLKRISKRAVEMGGTCTGEHGIGQGKQGSLENEAGPALAVMQTIKKALDPKGIMNPGKIFA